MTNQLRPTLGTWQLWGIAVGLVISGEYFGWSYGWGIAGTLGFLVTTLFVATMYSCFIFSFTELTTAIPHAGGPFAYSRRAFGDTGGLIAGMATLIEFVFAPPAIAMAIGAYLNVQFPDLNPKYAAVGAYLVFMGLNIAGVKMAAMFELVVTVLAVFELLVFMGVVAPGFSMANFVANGWAGSDVFSSAAMSGIFAAIPFAIWFFLAIEGAAMAAEEAKDPKRTIPRAYIGGILTLVVLAISVMLMAGGAGDWRTLSAINDPLPQAMKMIVGENSGWLHMLVWIGLFGLVASFHGIILGYSRQFFALARAGYLPPGLAKLSRFQTPHRAILAGGVIGIIAIFCDGFINLQGMSLTAAMITMAVFGAIVMYIMSMASLFHLRRTAPELERSYRAPGYPVVPAIALVGAVICLIAMLWFNPQIALLFIAFMVAGYLYFRTTHTRRASFLQAALDLKAE
ncbi:TPA: ethanolamine permease [Pseudomonas aeruginosa]|uniref:ethanolamine permease n=1 Tax=Pseudomonas aeruginosa TaxID=287 RepID=UPI001495484F|nr:ethanolamine permease [Pseudomonas aeruginosa]ELM7154613.1 ethanolamine permease [Pseudomonas aeruginosa]NPS71757.1 ethanolamine permease [Pseudomonas aeruginosa]HEJ1394747.1 ethanolamine permease [Pseudomonas aeruginosa]HEJ2075743.1 ethanolamine permease [Pseudomonas aeruginosa]HEJ2283747.1 ethanolamine permease [Pseudomonas aeruginosa]